MLAELELTYLKHSLNALLTDMHDALPKARDEYGDGVLKESVLDADYFLAVGRSLLREQAVPTRFNQEERVKETLAAVAKEGMHEFRLFGRERNMDFSHYEFEMRGVARETEEEWKADLLDAKVPPRPEWTRGYLVPHADRMPADGWIKQRMLLVD